MHKSTLLFISAISFVLSSSAIAESVWKQEVGNLRGIELGTNAYSVYKECPKKDKNTFSLSPYFSSIDSDYPPEFKDIPCYKVTENRLVVQGAKQLNIDNLMFIQGAGREAVVTLINDRVESIEVEFLNQHFEQIKIAMMEKYGNPSKKETLSFQNSFGQTFLAESLQWNGKSVMLLLDEHRSGDKDWGQIVMSSQTYLNKLNEWFLERKNSIKKGL